MPVPSGLSALIQAASSQLEQLDDEEPDHAHIDHQHHYTNGEDRIYSNGADHHDAHHSTRPEMEIPEPDPHKQTFPELLMTLALNPSNVDVITFLPDGKFFAIRAKEFSEDIMHLYFAVSSFEEFLGLLNDWGYSRIIAREPNCTGIEVFRHPLFRKGEWEMCMKIKFGESPTDARVSALPERARIECTLSDDSANTKRRLSPGFLARRESETSVTSQKQRLQDACDLVSLSSQTATKDGKGGDDMSCSGGNATSAAAAAGDGDDKRSIALAITTDKLKIESDESESDVHKSPALVDRAVKSATHTIVTDAIESLLRDEGHTKATYLKHEKELSKSSIPGVIPISKQLFSPKDAANDEPPKAEGESDHVHDEAPKSNGEHEKVPGDGPRVNGQHADVNGEHTKGDAEHDQVDDECNSVHVRFEPVQDAPSSPDTSAAKHTTPELSSAASSPDISAKQPTPEMVSTESGAAAVKEMKPLDLKSSPIGKSLSVT